MSLRGAAVLASGALMLLGVDAPASSRVPVKSTVLARDVPVEVSEAPAGEVHILTYNVAGLPRIVVGERARTMRHIGRLLNDFDLVLIQEDFSWHAQLARDADHAFRSRPGRRGFALLSDGLSTFSSMPFRTIERVPWEACNGIISADTDCLGSKGFSVAHVELAKGKIVVNPTLPTITDQEIPVTGSATAAIVKAPALTDFGAVDLDGAPPTQNTQKVSQREIRLFRDRIFPSIQRIPLERPL